MPYFSSCDLLAAFKTYRNKKRSSPNPPIRLYMAIGLSLIESHAKWYWKNDIYQLFTTMKMFMIKRKWSSPYLAHIHPWNDCLKGAFDSVDNILGEKAREDGWNSEISCLWIFLARGYIGGVLLPSCTACLCGSPKASNWLCWTWGPSILTHFSRDSNKSLPLTKPEKNSHNCPHEHN